MFPLQITAAQAVASCINGRIFKMETRCYGHKSTREIWRENGLIRAQQYWSQYGWLKETLREDTPIFVLKKFEETEKESGGWARIKGV